MVYIYTRYPRKVWPKKEKVEEKPVDKQVDVSEFFVDYIPPEKCVEQPTE